MSAEPYSSKLDDDNLETLKEAKAELDSEPSTTERVADKAHAAIDSTAEKAEDLEKSARRNAEQTREKLSEKGHAAADTLQDSLSEVQNFVKERPIAAAGIAFAAGIVASRLLRD